MAQNIGVLTVNTTIIHPADPVSGYAKAQRDALDNDTLIKVRKEAMKCNLVTKLSLKLIGSPNVGLGQVVVEN